MKELGPGQAPKSHTWALLWLVQPMVHLTAVGRWQVADGLIGASYWTAAIDALITKNPARWIGYADSVG